MRNMDKDNAEMDAFDRAMAAKIDVNEKTAPDMDLIFYDYRYKLWEMRHDYQEDQSKSFDENIRGYVKYNHKRSLIKAILDIKTKYFYESGEMI